jgi:urease accessory protein
MSVDQRGARGQLHLRFTAQTAATTVQVLSQTPPLRIVRGFPYDQRGVLVHLHNLSGGVLGGDVLTLQADVDCGAWVHLTTTGATRLYRQRTGQAPAQQQTVLHVATGGRLEYLPDLLIPFAGAEYAQKTQIDLANDAGLFYWEIVAPGREAHGECFDYTQLRLELDIRAAGQPIALERALIEPALRPLDSPARLGIYRYYGSFYICHVGQSAGCWAELAEALHTGLDRQHTDETVWGVSALPAHGLIVRGVSMTNRHLQTGFVHTWQIAKRHLYGREAVLPRKIY